MMKTLFYLTTYFLLLQNSFGQAIKDSTSPLLQKPKQSKNIIGTGIGTKNTYGVWGVFYGRKINIHKALFEVQIGFGIKNDFVVGGGVNVLIYTKKRFDLFIAADYSYNYAGIIRFDDEKKYQPYTSDKYSFTACQYAHTYLTGRYSFGTHKDFALQLKAGYGFLLNPVSIIHSSGPDIEFARAQRSVNSGLMVGLDFLVFF